MAPSSIFRPLWACLLLAACLAAGCGDPCRELSDEICRCMPSRAEQQACRKRVHALASQGPNRSPDQEASRTCQALLEGCTCDALARGDFAACGLATD